MDAAELDFWISYYPMLSTNPTDVEQKRKLESLLERFAIVWSGFFLSEQTGSYSFEITANDKMELELDGQVLGSGGLGRSADGFYTKAGSARPTRVTLQLAEGWHQIRARYYQNSGSAFAGLTYLPPNASHDIRWSRNVTIGNETLEILSVPMPGRLLCTQRPSAARECDTDQVGLIGRYFFMATRPPIPILWDHPSIQGVRPSFTRRELQSGFRWPKPRNEVVDPKIQQSTDAITASIGLSPDLWTGQHLFRLEWKRGSEGYLIFIIDGVQQFRLNASALNTTHTTWHEKRLSNDTSKRYSEKGAEIPGTFLPGVIP
eukprot:SAG31_NODE_79_length_27235_cov_6.268868_2_plen_318_part_00